MKKIYILLMHTKTVPARIIKVLSRYKYSHVGISLEKDCQIIYSFGRKRWNTIFDSGFAIEHKNGKFFKYFNKTTCRIYELEVTDEQYKDLKTILDDMTENKHLYKYDYLGLITRYFGLPIKMKNRYVCSYFIASLLEKADVYHFEKDAAFVAPKDFESISNLVKIYEGKYKSYKMK